jgi:hypothetical protein
LDLKQNRSFIIAVRLEIELQVSSVLVSVSGLKRAMPHRIFLIGILGCGVQLIPLGTAATNVPIVPAPGDYDDVEIGGMFGRGNRSARRKRAAVPLCPTETPHAARTRTRAAAVGIQRLTS